MSNHKKGGSSAHPSRKGSRSGKMKDHTKKKQCNARSRANAKFRAKESKKAQDMVDEYNYYLMKLNMPTVSLAFKHECPFKGGTKPDYQPTPEMMKNMTADDVVEWKNEQRKKRKALKQKENRMKKAQMLRIIQEQLPELKRKAEEKTRLDLNAGAIKDKVVSVAEIVDNCSKKTSAQLENIVTPADPSMDTLKNHKDLSSDDIASWAPDDEGASLDESFSPTVFDDIIDSKNIDTSKVVVTSTDDDEVSLLSYLDNMSIESVFDEPKLH